MLALISIILTYNIYGIESIRSSTYIIDANYLLVGGVIAQNYIKVFEVI